MERSDVIVGKFSRQVKRDTQKQEIDLMKQTAQILYNENKSLFRAMGAMVMVSGGEIRVPRNLDEFLKGKHLTSDVEGEEIVFRIVEKS